MMPTTERSTIPVVFTVPQPFCGHNPNQANAGFYDLAALLNEAVASKGWRIYMALGMAKEVVFELHPI